MVWFKKNGWMYYPVHIAGYLVTIMAIVFMVSVCMATFHNGHSISDDLYQLFVYVTCTAFWWKWIADKTLAR